MRKSFITLAAVGVAAFLVSDSAHAQKKEEKNITCNAEIKEIDTKAKAITVYIKDGPGAKKDRTIEIAGNTKIQKDGKINQRLKDLGEGDQINLTYRKARELGADKKTFEEVFKAVQIIVTTSASTNAPAKP